MLRDSLEHLDLVETQDRTATQEIPVLRDLQEVLVDPALLELLEQLVPPVSLVLMATLDHLGSLEVLELQVRLI